ncbi:MAG: glutamate 5-kinase [Geminicoccaceae bacterium]
MTARGVEKALAAQRLTIKIGSALLVDRGKVRRDWLDSLADDIAEWRARGQEIIVVTSGAIALGRPALGLKKRALRLEEKQAAAAAGQILLARAWQESLARHDLATAQLLVTPDDTEDRRRYLNARATVDTLLRLGAVPVVNENDTVATSEIRFGDNDRLGARVAVMAGSETLVLFSDVDGLYTANPSTDPAAVHIPEVVSVTPEIEAMAGESLSGVGSGGMVSKIAAARIATRAGTTVLLSRGSSAHPVRELAGGARCTVFTAQVTPRRARKDWIGAGLVVNGRLTIDDGAVSALSRGSSLLPAGVTAVDGSFERGDTVLVLSRDGRQLAKGLSAYDCDDARRIAGRKTAEIEALLGWRGRDEMIHRDDMVLL